MRSKLAEQSCKSLQEALARLTPEQRLEAFFRHSKAMIELKEAGEKLRRQRQGSPA
jgi:hypothetical protein